MTRLMFIINNLAGGGAERVISHLANEFVKRDFEIIILLVEKPKPIAYELNSAIKIRQINTFLFIPGFRKIEKILSINREIKKFNPDCIVAFLTEACIKTIIANRFNKIPLIISERNDPNSLPEIKILRSIRNFIYTFADAFVFQTTEAEKYFLRYINRAKPRFVIPNPVKQDLPFHKNIPSNTRLITACRLEKQKNLFVMIDSISLLKSRGVKCELDIYGEGTLRKEIESYIESKHLTGIVKLRGFSKDIHSAIANSAAFIITSDYEGISNSMIEALAIGTPVVATDCPIGGAKMFIKDGYNGFLVKVGDTFAVAQKIEYILKHPIESEVLGKNATTIRYELAPSHIADDWFNFITYTISNYGK